MFHYSKQDDTNIEFTISYLSLFSLSDCLSIVFLFSDPTQSNPNPPTHPPHPIPAQPSPAHPIPPDFILSHPIPSYLTPFHPIPLSHSILSHSTHLIPPTSFHPKPFHRISFHPISIPTTTFHPIPPTRFHAIHLFIHVSIHVSTSPHMHAHMHPLRNLFLKSKSKLQHVCLVSIGLKFIHHLL